jgi:hypothetical protein
MLDEFPSCTLDAAGRTAQTARYSLLRASAERVHRAPEEVVIDFGEDLDAETLDQTLAVERECCPFLELEFDPRARRLRVTVREADMVPALGAIASAFDAS